MSIFTQFIKYIEGNFVSYFDIFPMLQKLILKSRSLRVKKHAETLMQAVSRRFSRITNLNVIFVCCLVTPARKRYYVGVQRPSAFAASMEAMWQQGVETLDKASFSDVAEMTRFFQDSL
jgi:hypothetical protein